MKGIEWVDFSIEVNIEGKRDINYINVAINLIKILQFNFAP